MPVIGIRETGSLQCRIGTDFKRINRSVLLFTSPMACEGKEEGTRRQKKGDDVKFGIGDRPRPGGEPSWERGRLFASRENRVCE